MLHLTITGVNAGATLCAERRNESDTYVHAALAPRDMLESPELHPMCKHVWECESDACFDADHAPWERTQRTSALF